MMVPIVFVPARRLASNGLRRLLVAAAFALIAFAPSDGHARNKYLAMAREVSYERTPAYRYANMTNREALRELDRRGIPYKRVQEKVRGVRAPVRLTGELWGVHIRSSLPESEWETTIFNILDARLALALYDLCRVLSQHDVVEVMHFTMYRLQGKFTGKPRFRHPGGLAIDLGAMKKRNGEWLSVGPHWTSAIGAQTCGAGARKLIGRRGRELMSIMCEVADQRIFHYMLSPHFDEPHSDHWHLEIKPGVKWFLVN
jgi:hypothetical protein